MEQYLSGSGDATPNGRQWYVTSPVSAATSQVFDAAGSNKLWSYSESGNGYTEITDNSTALNTMQGYVARLGANTTITFTGGAFNTGNISNANITRTGTANAKRGYHLIGNPYPSYLNWDDVSKTNLSTTMSYRTNSGSAQVFDTYNATSGIGTNNNLGGAVTKYIPPMQSFWVSVDTDGLTGELNFTDAMRSHQTGTLRSVTDNNLIRLTLADATNSDEAIIHFNANASNSFDDFDSKKMFVNSGVPEIYTQAGTESLVINGLTDIASNPSVQLNLVLPANGNFKLNATEISGFDANQKVYLEDKELNKIQDLTQKPVYEFSATASSNNQRFALLFQNQNPNGINNAKASDDILVYSAAGNAIINLMGNQANGTVTIYDALGKTVSTQAISSNISSISLPAANGIYLVEVKTNDKTYMKKLAF
jgi:hypothetical protein